MTFHRESSFQCTNTTNVSASNPAQKLVYSKIFFNIQCLLQILITVCFLGTGTQKNEQK